MEHFFKINLEAIPRTHRFQARSFFIDEEKKRVVFFSNGSVTNTKSERNITTQLTSLERMASLKQWILEELTLPIIFLVHLCAPTLMFQV